MEQIINTNPVNNLNSSIIKRQADKDVNKEKDTSNINSGLIRKENTNIIMFSEDRIEIARKQMEKEGYRFNDEGLAPAIVYGSEGKQLLDAERAIVLNHGQITGSLWLLNAFTADLSPQAYCYLKEHMEGYSSSPDNKINVIKDPKNIIFPNQILMDLSIFLGIK